MKTILIVDDIYENLYLLKVVLEEAGYKVLEANDGKEGLGILKNTYDNKDKVDLIISDILMPVMDGYIFCQECKKDKKFSHIPFIYYTSTYTEKLDEEFALKLGAVHFLRKPTDQEKILKVIQGVLKEDQTTIKSTKGIQYSEQEVLKLYSERLISKLEQKKIDLDKEVSERIKAEQLLIHKNEILDLIALNTPIDEIFNKLLLNFESVHPEYFGSLSLLNDDGVHLNLVAAPSMPKPFVELTKTVEIGESQGSCGTAAFTKKPIIVSDISTDKLWVNYKDIALENNLRSCWSLPILSENNDVLGTFAIYSKTINTPSLQDIRELKLTRSLISVVIEKFKIIGEIKKKDESYKALMNQASDAILSYSLDGTIHTFNKATYQILGYTLEEFSKLSIHDFLVGDFISDQNLYDRIVKGESVLFERQMRCKDNTIIDLEITAKKQLDGKVLSIGRNITERKKVEAKLKESEYYLKQSQIVANLGSYVVDLKTEFWEGSDVLDELFGIDASYERTVKSWNARIHPDEQEELLSYFEQCVANNERFNKEYRIIKYNTKEEIWAHGIGELVFDEENNPIKLIGTIQDITDRKKSQIKLQESEYSLRQSQVVGNIGSYVLDLNTRIWESSAVLNNVFGISESYVKTIDSWVDIIHPDEREQMLNYLENGIKNNRKFNKEYRVVKLNTKEEIWVHGTGEFIYDKDGKSIKMIGTMQDITHRKKSEIKLQESEYNLRQSQIVANIGSYTIDLKSGAWGSSKVLDKIFGINESYVKSVDGWIAIIHPNHIEKTVEHFTNAIKNRKKIDIEYKIVKIDSKEEAWVHAFGEFIFDSDANPVKVIGTTQDITERKNNELELKVANEFSSSLLKSMHEGLFAINLDSEIISVNPSFCKMTGFTEEELLGLKRPYPFSPPELKKENDKRYKLLIQNKNTKDYENIYMRKNGERFPVHVMVSSIYDENGIKTANFATVEDITERRKAEIDLKLAKDFNDKLMMSMQEGLLILDMLGKIIKVNESLCKILGYSEQELIGLELPYPFAKAEDLEKMENIKLKVENDEAPSFQLEFIRKNGDQFYASFLTGTIKNDNGEVIAIFATVKDSSEEEKAKKVLEQNAKKSLERKNVILELASLVGKDYKEALNKITALAAKTLNVDRGSILKFNNDRTKMLCEKLYHLKNDSYEKGQVFCKKGNERFFATIDENKIVSATDVLSHKLFQGSLNTYFIPLNIKSKLSIPIQGINEVYGILCFEHLDTLHEWSRDEEEFATSIANLVSLMIQSTERKLAEKASAIANHQLTLANEELNKLRDQLEQENVYLRNELDLVFNYEEMVYGSTEFSNVLTEIEKVAPTNATVLLLGESGTGKELLARAIHNISARNNKPLIKVNCSAIPRELLESELFGHKKGSFTGAFNDKIGKFELAHNGTLFLDEIGELPLDMQPKILRFLQEGEIEVVGGAGTKKLDVRVVAATNRNLKEEIAKKRFREDLFFRLNVFPINVPALRKRKDDIPLLVEHFVDKFNKDYGKTIKYIADESMNKLKLYDWPGNIRELENLIERATILSTEETLFIPGFESSSQTVNPINKKDLSLDVAQRNHILHVLEQCKWKISGPDGASNLLQIKPSTLRDRMKKLDIKKP
ncbi:PAS domain S-box protein [Winogradskyella psychrotolerans]|uniref:PAS domain S-box protein n=1 Tax=Winogradskyella psychrotolerans TaxID=1344585 RepID=UPI001C075161|nr:PAS domain S-box protein [Winogradskyella psychrotolerans]MBU2920528.1 PAS domain S-box protein [Winogradskyella psychrotolerans]